MKNTFIGLMSLAHKLEARVETSTQVLNEIMAIPEQGIPPALLRNAKAVAVLPGVIKAGLILGGRGGYGILVVHNEDGSWSNPNFIGLAGGGIGLQIGAQATDFILVFKSRKDVDTIVRGKTTLGADVGVAGLALRPQASSSAPTTVAPMASTDFLRKSLLVTRATSRDI